MDNPTETFDATYRALTAAGVDAETKSRTLDKLALSMIDTWDDVDECAEQYADDAVVAPIFQQLGVLKAPVGTVEVRLHAHEDPDETWDQFYPDMVRKLGWPAGDPRYRLNNVLYEIGVDVEVDRTTGACRIIGLEGTRLTEPLPWN